MLRYRIWRSTMLPALALLVACGGREAVEFTRRGSSGPDPIVVRVALKGGKARAYRYPALDSTIWTSSDNVPQLGRLLAFDHENGVLAFADTSGRPGWVDLRLGTVRLGSTRRHQSLTTADGWAIFGISGKNEIARFTPTGDWSLDVKSREITRLLPYPDGTLLVLFRNEEDDERSLVMRIRPPDSRWLDSLEVERPQQAVATEVGDRVYLAFGRRVLGVSTSGLTEAVSLRLRDSVVAIAPTPSGDRLYIVSSGGIVDVVDRYSGADVGTVELPGPVAALRMDGMGRYVIARAESGNSAWIISTASNRYLGAVEGSWRADLPAVAVDGSIATVRGDDVLFVDPQTLQEARRYRGGAADAWFFMLWNGFRPRAEGIDQPVQFSWRGQDSIMAAALGDTGLVAFVGRRDTTARVRSPVVDSVRQPPPPEPQRTVWTVSFAVVLSEARARELASEIAVGGERAHVVAGRSGDTPVFRVVLGPYPTRGDAERVGRASGRQFWVYDGVP